MITSHTARKTLSALTILRYFVSISSSESAHTPAYIVMKRMMRGREGEREREIGREIGECVSETILM